MSLRLNTQEMDKVAAKIAELTISGTGTQKIVSLINEEYKISINHRTVERYRKREIYQTIMRDYTEGLVKNALAELKRETSTLVPEIIAALKAALQDGNIGAIPHALKILGIDSVDSTPQTQSLTVVLPGSTQEAKTIDITDSEDA